MKSTPALQFCIQTIKQFFPASQSLRTFNASLLCLLMLTAPLAPLSAATNRSSAITTRIGGQATSQQTAIEVPALEPDDKGMVPAAVGVTASLAADIALGAKKNPGDVITYTAVISTGGASPADDATGVVFSDILDSNTTLVGGSLNAQPIAKADAYTASGNIAISIAAPGVLSNDIDPMTGTNAGLTVTEVQGLPANVGVATSTTAVGRGAVNGSVNMAGNGSFTYEPPPGFTGSDTFTYKSSEGTLTDTNTVTITISNMVWFIKNTGGGSNRGTFSDPFTTIATFNTANAAGGATDPKNGDIVSLRTGTYSEADGVNLRNTQKLIGEAIQFNTVFTADSNSNSAYTTFAGATNTAPTVNATAGNGIDLADSNTVRGLNVGTTPGFFGFNGTAVGSPTINTVNKTGTGGAINVSTSGTFGATVSFGTLESSSSPGANINLVGVTGTLGITSGGTGLTGSAASSNAINISGGTVGFTYPGNVTKASLGSLLNVSGGHTGTLIFNTGTLSATAGDGLQFNNADGTYTFSGTTTLNGGDAGVDVLNDSAGTFNFNSSTTITSPSGTAFNVSKGAAATCNPTVAYAGTITQNTAAQRVVNVDSTTGGSVGFTGTVTGSSVAGGVTGTGININAGNGNVSFSTLNLGTSGTRMTNQAVTITNGTGTYGLGAVSIFTSNISGIVSTNADGTLNSTSGTVDTIGASAISIDGPAGLTTLGMTLTAVNVDKNGATIPAKGISVQDINGSFAVNGTGTTAGSGGTIQSTTTRGLEMIGPAAGQPSLSLKNMNFTNNAQSIQDTAATCANIGGGTNLNCSAAIHVVNVTGFTLDKVDVNGSNQVGVNGNNVTTFSMINGSKVRNCGNEANENGMQFANLLGTSAITGATFATNYNEGLDVVNTSSTAGSLTVTSGTFTGNGIGTHGSALMKYSGDGAANMTVNVQSSSFNFNNSYGYYTDTATTAHVTSTINNSTFGTVNAVPVAIGYGISGSSKIDFTVTNNTIVGGDALQGSIFMVGFSETGITTASSYLNGTYDNNTIGTTGVIGSGCKNGCGGVGVFPAGAGGMNLSITNNQIRQVSSQAISLSSNAGTSGALTMKIKGNIIAEPQTGFSSFLRALVLTPGNSAVSPVTNPTSCFDIGGAGTSKNTISGSWLAGSYVRVQNANNAGTTRFPGYAGSTTSDTALNAFVEANNTIPAGNVAVTHGTAITGGAACPLLFALGGIVSASDMFPLMWSYDDSQLSAINVSTLATPSNTLSDSLSQPQLDAIVTAATQRWAATGLTQGQLTTLRSVKFEIADLQGAYLGEADGNRIQVDRNAEGKGWFVDANPLSDSSFAHTVSATRRYTDPMNDAAGHIDLLTAIEHEMGHRLGLDDSYAAKDRDSIMYGYLTVGERRLPARGQAKDIEPGALKGSHFLSLGPKNPATKRMSLKRAATADDHGLSPLSGETVTVNGAGTGFTLPGGDSVTITFQATVNTPPTTRAASTQGKVSGSNFVLVNGITTANPNTNDPETAAVNDATVTNINTTSIWTGATNTNWSVITNWSPNTYAPGIGNSAINDVVIPQVVPNDPTLSVNADIFSLTINNSGLSKTVTISSGSTLTIDGAAAGSDLNFTGTIPIIIAGGALNFAGAGPHTINNANGQGRLSATNAATILSGASVTQTTNFIMGTLAVNSGATMNISNRTLGLAGPGAALTVAGMFTTTGSTVQFQGGAPQTTDATSFANLTIFNDTGVTLNANASVSGVLNFLSGNIITGANTLTLGSAGTITRTSGHVVGTLKKTAVPNGAFTFTVGTANGYTPLVLANASGGGDLTVTTTATAHPLLDPAHSLQEYWTLTEGGTVTADLTFNYLQTDVVGNEATYRLIRISSGTAVSFAASVNTATNTATRTGVSNFSDWTVGEPIAPTAANGVVTGRIVDNNGNAVEGAVIRLDGTQNRKFITDANGFYRFDNVETTGFYTVTPSRANYTFSPSQRSFSLLGQSTEAAFGATLASGSNYLNPLDTPEYFVRQHYIDFLGREPDEAGFNFWSDQIIGCGLDQDCIARKRDNVSAAYFLSIEFQNTGGLVDGLYRASYGAPPQFSQFMPDTRTVAQGVIVGNSDWQTKLVANKQAFAEAFVNRPAFHAMYDNMDNTLFVDTLISHTGVTFTSGERDALVDGLANGTLNRAAALQNIAENQRFVDVRFNQAFVMMEYFGYLRRDPDAVGYEFWLNKLNQFNGNFEQAEMVKAFIVSGEYRQRFPR
ncbi:MAG TPA: hypothetical protein DC047_13930 [Blastocatellia bacterium]|nr:hypothetical protein [Blastocatellia bacterium]